MNNIDLEEKTYTTTRRGFPVFSLGMIVVGAVMLIGGAVFYKTSDRSKYTNVNTISVSEEIDLGKTRSVDIKASAGKLEIRRSNDDKVHLEGNVPKDYVLKESGGILRVGLERDFYISFDFMQLGAVIDAVLYLPDTEYNNIKLDAGAGEITVSEVKCDTASLDTGTGELNISDIECKGLLDADIGTGELDISNAKTGGLKVDLGTGDFTFNGEVNGDINVDCGVGDCNINLTNDEDEFNKKYSIKTDTGIGDVKVTFNN